VGKNPTAFKQTTYKILVRMALFLVFGDIYHKITKKELYNYGFGGDYIFGNDII